MNSSVKRIAAPLTAQAPQVDYELLSSGVAYDATYKARILAALVDLITNGGVPASKAVSLIAISINEGAVIWGTPREVASTANAMWWKDGSICTNYRQIVGWESNSSSNPLAIPATIQGDAKAMAYLQSRGGVTADGTSLQAPFFHGFQSGLDCWELARFLEWCIDNEDTTPLSALAIGPTQMDLQFSALVTGAANKPGYPTTWDELFQLYNSPTPGAMADQIVYLDPPATGITSYPADHPDDAVTNLQWLSFQTGTGGGYPEAYWETGTTDMSGDGGTAQTMYNGWLWRVCSLASSIGLFTCPSST